MATAPYGSWSSPLSAELVAGAKLRLDSLTVDGGDLYWLEGRPSNRGRYTLVRNGQDLTPPDFNVRTHVHEYGGGAYVVLDGIAYVSNFDDGRLYRLAGTGQLDAITPADGSAYADGCVSPEGILVCVREREGRNELVAIRYDGSSGPVVVARGADFYSNPRLSPDGKHLAYLSWNLPNMPWDGTDLWLANLDGSAAEHVAGGPKESIFQPEWSPDGVLHYVSDRTGWWNLYSVNGPRGPMEAEFGRPQWVFGMATYAFLGPDRITAIYTRDGFDYLALLEAGAWRPIELPFTAFQPQIVAWRNRLVFIAAGPAAPSSLVAFDPDTGATEVLRRSFEAGLDRAYMSEPRAISFGVDAGQRAHALFYPPANPNFVGPADERPPLIVISHGGPTGQTQPRFDPEIAFWTSRGFALADVNYRGSTGYGRAYRELLAGQWGITDVADCIAAARFLVRQGEADGRRLIVRGASAGGYTTLSALTFHDAFAAGASYFGVSDLTALEVDTHKFESRYLDKLVGSWPEEAQLFHDRSPIHYTDRLACPIILFQGLDDKIVPPSQAQAMADALQAKGLPYVHRVFPGEGHGFRDAENVRQSLEDELSFYSQIFGFPLADPIQPVRIENFP